MQLKELLVRLPLFEVLTGDPHLIEVSRVEELRAEMDPLPGTLYLSIRLVLRKYGQSTLG